MTDARMKSFFDKMVLAGGRPGRSSVRNGYTLRFIGKGVGLEEGAK